MIMDKLTVKQQEQKVSEEQRIALAVAKQDARQAQLQWEEKERKASMLQSIAEHRELMVTAVFDVQSLVYDTLQPLCQKKLKVPYYTSFFK